ncbi:MAG: hypothetical protein SVR04_06905 [Spirochaetota bacterium]|nr:hypothetical protein [Spirochaetota bacterium]
MWDDVRVTADMVTMGELQHTPPPKRVHLYSNQERSPSYTGIWGYGFDHGRDGKGLFQNAYFNVQLPHSYAEGSPVEPHVHVRLLPGGDAATGQKLLLELEYVWVNVGERAPEDSSILPLNYTVRSEDLTGGNTLISFGFIEKPDAQISSMLSCRFSRITIEDEWQDYWRPAGFENDSFIGTMVLLEFDFHIRMDTAGSKELYEK